MPLPEAKWTFNDDRSYSSEESGVKVCKGEEGEFEPITALEIIQTFNRMKSRILELEARIAFLRIATKDFD